MNISKAEQRALHELALGGAIHFVRRPNGKIATVRCYTREGFALAGFTLRTFTRLKRRGFVRSEDGKPYRVTRKGIQAVRSELNQT